MDRKGTKVLNLFGFLKNKTTKNTYVTNDYNKDEIEEFKNLYNPVENKTLDDEQISSIVSNSHNTLVIASAGSGKTTTIIGKIKYLILKYNVLPEEILVLSFTNASAKEMKSRITKELNLEINASTFHKLGLEIIKKTSEHLPNIYTDNSEVLILNIVNKLLNNCEYLVNFIDYFCEENKVQTFLYAFSVSFQYDEVNNEFYLISYDVFITFKKEKNKIHFKGSLVDLYNELTYLNVKLKLRDYNYIWKLLNISTNMTYNIITYFLTLISLVKSNSLSNAEFSKRYDKTISSLFIPVITSYNEYLKDNNMIDFNDMINLSTKLIKENKYIHNYKYVIVDEYQDISIARYNLLKAMRNQKDYDLFCVGDDFQSIYRFSGSQINLITNFEDFWGETMVGRISRTYRFSDTLAKISSSFVMKNPSQLRKNIIGLPSDIFPLEMIYSIEELKSVLNSLPLYSTVYFLGRYNNDLDIIRSDNSFSIVYNNGMEIIYSKRIDLVITYLTIHKSKGLQSDYVFILNNKADGSSFPSKIKDDEIVYTLLDNTDKYPYSEERRLFYVGLTRSKKKTYLLVDKNSESIFIEELKKSYKL